MIRTKNKMIRNCFVDETIMCSPSVRTFLTNWYFFSSRLVICCYACTVHPTQWDLFGVIIECAQTLHQETEFKNSTNIPINNGWQFVLWANAIYANMQHCTCIIYATVARQCVLVNISISFTVCDWSGWIFATTIRGRRQEYKKNNKIMPLYESVCRAVVFFVFSCSPKIYGNNLYVLAGIWDYSSIYRH